MSVALERPAVVETVGVEAVDASHRYGPGRGLDPVSFAIASPGCVAVTGANGTGKSTLMRMIAGLLRPTRGALRVTFSGATAGPAERRRGIGYAAPDLDFYDEFGVAENLVFAAEARGLAGAGAAVNETLARVGLASRAGDRAQALSSGMIQRMRLAFALLGEPPLLLLDEPGSHMDDEGRELVAGVVDRQRRSGLVIIATNDEREWKLADQRIELRGRGLGHPA